MKPRLISDRSWCGGCANKSQLLAGNLHSASLVRSSCLCRPPTRANPASSGHDHHHLRWRRRRALQLLLAVTALSCLLLVDWGQDAASSSETGIFVGLRRRGRFATAQDNGQYPSDGTGTVVVKQTILRISDFPPRPASPFEERWPGEELPLYAEKPFFLRQFEYPATGCFVHVGKTAGSSLGCALGFRLHCQKELKHPRGYLPRLTTNLLHSDVNDCTHQHDYYLFSVRNPLERIQSWYVYEEKKLQPLIANCSFATLNDLAELGLETVVGYKARLRSLTVNATTHGTSAGASATPSEAIRPPGSTRCRYKSRRVIRGTEKLGSHAYYNYARYMTQIPERAAIGVIRTPHLVQDYNSMEAYVTNLVHDKKEAELVANASRSRWVPFGLRSGGGGSKPPPPGQVSRLGSKNRTPRTTTGSNGANETADSLGLAPADPAAAAMMDPRRYLSDRARTLLCAALCDEIQVYKRILRHAVNLDASDVRQSLDELRQSCPVETDLPGACLY